MTKTYTKEEQAEHRAQLVTALRSGDYKQHRGALIWATPEGSVLGNCCLGVGCELAAAEGVTKRFVHPGSTRPVGYEAPYGAADFGYDNSYMPEPVRQYYGFGAGGGNLLKSIHGISPEGKPEVARTLAHLNDVLGWTFAQIADLIEAGGVQLEA